MKIEPSAVEEVGTDDSAQPDPGGGGGTENETATIEEKDKHSGEILQDEDPGGVHLLNEEETSPLLGTHFLHNHGHEKCDCV